MKKEGSMTVFFSLVTLILFSLITASIFTAKVASGRALAAGSVDQALFSLFARYDQPLYDRYQLFFVDGGCGTSSMCPGAVTAFLKEAANENLIPDKGGLLAMGSSLLAVKAESCSLTGYTLATDQMGAAFEAQAIDSVKDTLGAAGITRLTGRHKDTAGGDTAFGQSRLRESRSVTYDSLQKTAGQKPGQTASDASGSDPVAGPKAADVPPDFINPLPILDALKKGSLLPLIIDDYAALTHEADSNNLLSSRAKAEGMGIIRVSGIMNGVTDRLLYAEYMLRHFRSYTTRLPDEPLTLEIEYLISGKTSDRAALEKVAGKLLLMREAANILFLETDPVMHARLSREALLCATAMGIPEAAILVQILLAGAWAFAESIVDLHAMLSGKKVAAIKTTASWQVDADDLPDFFTDIRSIEKDSPGGCRYEDYLRLLLMKMKRADLTPRAMNLIELNLRKDRPHFRFDLCFDTLSADFSILSEKKIPLTVSGSLSYRDL